MAGGTPIGNVRGLGAGGGGTHHWFVQRATAVGNLLLMSWLVASLVLLPAHDHAAITGWLAQPIVALPMMLLLFSVFNHLRLGLQVLIEDYVHDEGLKFAALLAVTFYAIGVGGLGLFCVAKIAFAGSAF